jgi:hypothetical protein
MLLPGKYTGQQRQVSKYDVRSTLKTFIQKESKQ